MALCSVRTMQLKDVVKLLKARTVTTNPNLETEIENVGAADLMSDVLALTLPGSLLLTGLSTVQVIRTAEMLDLKAIVFVRDKTPDAVAVTLAEEMGLPLFTSAYPLYEACGILYVAGLPGSLNQRPGSDGHHAGAVPSTEKAVVRSLQGDS